MFGNITEFEWDEGNRNKSLTKHGVTWNESEQIFFNNPIIVHEDLKHSHNEKRFYALGQTNQSRKLMIVFTIRKNKIRIISARPMHKNERAIYEKT